MHIWTNYWKTYVFEKWGGRYLISPWVARPVHVQYLVDNGARRAVAGRLLHDGKWIAAGSLSSLTLTSCRPCSRNELVDQLYNYSKSTCYLDLSWLNLCFMPYVLSLRVEHRRPQTTCLHPALSCAAASIFLQLYLYPPLHMLSGPTRNSTFNY